MKIILKKLKLAGFKKLTGKWEFSEDKNVFLGQNGTGKTTLCDAERWLRTGKDSLDSAKFDIKTIVDGKSISRANHSVIGIYDIDGQKLTLERVYAEKWTKTRGKIDAEFSGHTTTYRVNEKANTTKKAFDAKVDEVFGGETFRLASDTRYFSGLKWERRREILTEMTGEIDKNALIDSASGLRESLDGLTVEERADAAAQSKRKINEELKTLPARIDEHRQQISKVTDGVDLEEASKKFLEAKKAVAEAQKKIDDFKSDESSETVEQLKELNKQLRKEVSEFENDKNRAQSVFDGRTRRLKAIVDKIKERKDSIKRRVERITDLKTSWKDIRSGYFKEQENACNCCGKIIVCPHCDGKDAEAESLFNQGKSERLQVVTEEGKKLVLLNKEAEEKNIKWKKEKTEIEALKPPKILSLTDSDKTLELRGKIQVLELEKGESETETPAEFLEAHKKAQEKLEATRDAKSLAKSNSESEKRIEELEKRMATLSTEFDQNEKFLFLFDEYNRRLAKATEGPVNKMFEYARFRMFATQINGAVAPCCDILNNEGKAYETALSAGERMRAELDIIKTMSKHFQARPLVFIDGAESITRIPALDCQTIELRHSLEHKELTQI